MHIHEAKFCKNIGDVVKFAAQGSHSQEFFLG
jgi:hypothetical protein